MKIGDLIQIVDYGNPNDVELIQWAQEQENNCFPIQEIDFDSRVFFIPNCEYGIPFDSVDYVVVSHSYEIHFKYNEEDELPEGYSINFNSEQDAITQDEIIALAKSQGVLDEDDLADLEFIDYAIKIK